MGRGTLSEKLLLAVPLLAAACSSDHRVSPWGSDPDLSLRQLFQPPDLGGQVGRLDAETASLGLRVSEEIRVKLPLREGEALIRGYEGHDALGRPVHAVRVATPRGIVLAVGPADAADTRRDQATELVPALVRAGDGAGAYQSGTDLNGDKLLDVLLRSEAGTLAIWHFAGLGAAPYEIEMKAPPQRAIDLDEDGLIDLAGDLPIEAGDPLAPRLTDVASFDGTRYSDRTEAARAWHARRAEPPDPAPPGPPPRPEARLRAALERAFHAALGGKERKGTLEELDREVVPKELGASFHRLRERIAALFPARNE